MNKHRKHYFIIWIIILFLLTECVLRLIRPRIMTVNNYEFKYFLITNSHNFRNVEFHQEKRGKGIRIFLLGDSIVFGAGVDDGHTIAKLMEEEFKKKGIRCEVYNLGICRAGTSDYLAIAKQFRRFNPDIVILSLYVDNDIETKSKLFQNGTIFCNLSRDVISCLDSSKIVSLFKAALYKIYLRNLVNESDIDGVYKQMMFEGLINPGLLLRARKGDNQRYYDSLVVAFNTNPITKKNMLAIKNMYNDKRFVLLINPSKYQVHTKYCKELKKIGFIFNRDDVVDNQLQLVIMSWARLNSIDCLDILPFMREKSDGSFFYRIDDHYNKYGNQLVAEKLCEHLMKIDLFEFRQKE